MKISTAISTVKAIWPLASNIIGLSDDAAFTAWRQTPLNRLRQLEIEKDSIKQDLQMNLSVNEQYSPISGVNKTLNEYLLGVNEDKLEFLRNALINGISGDYTLELREELYRMANVVQPLDIQVLMHLLAICPNIDTYVMKKNDSQESNEERSKYAGLTLGIIHFNEREEKTLTLDGAFPTKSLVELQISLDRLREAKLICNPQVGMRFGTFTPYTECLPTRIAQTFIDFISDPRNKKRAGTI